MRGRNSVWIFILAGMLLLTGCVHNLLISDARVLTYERPYDFTFLAVIRAVEGVPDWELSSTDQPNGVVIAQNLKYWDVLDADKRSATLVVKRVSRSETSVALAPESRNIIGVSDLLDAVDAMIAQLLQA